MLNHHSGTSQKGPDGLRTCRRPRRKPSPKSPKTVPKRIPKIRCSNCARILSRFGSTFGAIWTPLASIFYLFWTSENIGFTVVAPTIRPGGTLQNALPNRLQKMIRFSLPFDPPLAPIWPPFVLPWPPKCIQKGSQNGLRSPHRTQTPPGPPFVSFFLFVCYMLHPFWLLPLRRDADLDDLLPETCSQRRNPK